jgi:hypothetical protein
MADLGYIESEIASLPKEMQPVMKRIMRHLLLEFRLGRATNRARATNLQGYFFTGTTDATPGTEFSIAHPFKRAPYLALPVLDLQSEGAELVPLQVSRVADTERIYLTSSEASVPFALLVEA